MFGRPKIVRFAAGLIVGAGLSVAVCAQEASPAPQGDKATGASSSKSKPQQYSHANDYVVRGTVFNEKALSLRGAQLRIRRSGDKKFRWESYTNSRGEFAMRVPQGADYELVVHAKGYVDQTRAVHARETGDGNFVFRLASPGGKP